jgi:hypothetical protein
MAGELTTGGLARGLGLVQGGGAIGGIAIGSYGQAGTPQEGLRLTYGDDFDTLPTMFVNRTKAGKYASSGAQTGSRRTASTSAVLYIDEGYRGARSQSPSDLGYSTRSVSAGVLRLEAQPTPAPLIPFLPTNRAPVGQGGDANGVPMLIGTRLATWPTFMMSAAGDFALECRVRLPQGAPVGYFPAFWSSALNWPELQEADVFEALRVGTTGMTYQSNVNGNVTNGGPNTPLQVVSRTQTTSRFIRMMMVKRGTTISFYDDLANAGTMVLVATTTQSRFARFGGAHDIRLDINADVVVWDVGTFTQGNWPAAVEFDWFRVWTASDRLNAGTVELGTIQTTPGGSWTASFPSALSLYGETVSREEVFAVFDNIDCPGAPAAANFLPGGVTVDTTTRNVTGTVPVTEGGRTGLLFLGSFADGGPARRAILWYDVAPAVQNSLFGNSLVTYNSAISMTVAPTSFHSGNLGPHTYDVTSNKGWAAVSGNGTGSVTISGTAPSSDDVATLTISCTNAIGQTTTVQRTITAQAVVEPQAIDFFSDGNSTVAPDGWSPSWVTTGVAWLESSLGVARGTVSTAGRHALRWTVPGDVADGEVLTKLRGNLSTGSSSTYEGVIVRGSGSSGAESGYRICLGRNGASATNIAVTKLVAGAATALTSPTFTWAVNTYYWMRVRFQSGNIKVRVWADGQAEPGTWNVDITDTDISTGWVGLACADTSQVSEWDQFSYLAGVGSAPAS